MYQSTLCIIMFYIAKLCVSLVTVQPQISVSLIETLFGKFTLGMRSGIPQVNLLITYFIPLIKRKKIYFYQRKTYKIFL